MVNYYQELEIDQSLEGDKLEEAIRNTQRKWLRRTNAPSLHMKQEAERKISLIEEAKKVLLDENKRKEYDQKLGGQGNFNDYELPNEEILDRNTNTNLNDVDMLIQQAENLIAMGKYADAIMIARKATELGQQNSEAWAVLAYANNSWGQVDNAIYEYKKAIDLAVNNGEYYYELGNIYLDLACENINMGRLAETNNYLLEAKECVNKALILSPGDFNSSLLLAEIARLEGDSDKAIKTYKEMLNLYPNNEGLKELLSDTYFEKGKKYLLRDEYGNYRMGNLQDTKIMVRYMKKARDLIYKSEYNSFVKDGEAKIKKMEERVFDKGNLPALIIPALFLFNRGIIFLLGLVAAGAVIYSSLIPRYKATNIPFKSKSILDKIYIVLIMPFFSIVKFVRENISKVKTAK